MGDDGVNQNETLTILHVEIAHSGKLFLERRNVSGGAPSGDIGSGKRKYTITKKTHSTGGIENLKHVLLVVDLDELAIRILDRGVVLEGGIMQR